MEFSRLSQRDPNPLGEKALALHPEQWKHGETEHFIYHFVNSYVVTPISVEAEFHYRVVAKELQREQPPGDTKSHIYVFERPADWQQFQAARPSRRNGRAGFIRREASLSCAIPPTNSAATLSDTKSLISFSTDFTRMGFRCWLDEGFAQYVSKGAHASYQRARGYIAKPHSQAIATEELIPLAALVAMTQPPSDQRGNVLQSIGAPGSFSCLHRQTEAFSLCSMRSRGISRSSPRSFAFTPGNSRVSRRSKNNSANTRRKIPGASLPDTL